MGKYGSSGPSSPFSPKKLSSSAVSCHKAFSFLCSRINNSTQQQPKWETRRQLCKFEINEKKDGSSRASITSTLRKNSGRRRKSENNSNPSQIGKRSIKMDEIPAVPLPRNCSSPLPQPEVFVGGVEVGSYDSNTQSEGLDEDIVGSTRGGGGGSSSSSASMRNMKNEILELKSENAMLKERVNELQSLYDGLLSLNWQNTAGMRKSRVRMQSAFLQAQVLQLRRQIHLQWIAVDAGVEVIQEVKGSLYALKDILRTHCDDIGSTSSTTISPPERWQTSIGGQRKVKFSWQETHNEVVKLLCRIKAVEHSAGCASNFRIHVPSNAGCFVGCGLSRPRELRLRHLSIADDIDDEPTTVTASRESCILPSHVNVGAVAALGESLSKSLEALVELIKVLQEGSLDIGGEEAEQARQLLRSKAGSLSHSFSELVSCVGALGMAVPVKGVNAQDAVTLKVRELARGVSPSKESGNACLRSIIQILIDSQRASNAAVAMLEDERGYWKRMASMRDEAFLNLARTLRDIGRDHAMNVNGGCLKAVALTEANTVSASNYGLLRRGGAGQEVAELLVALECSRDMLKDVQSALENYSNKLALQVNQAWSDFDSSYSACVTATNKEEGNN